MRIAIVYDCLYPNTVGGAERWLRALAERLGEEHEVTYVTRRQWRRGEEPRIPGVRCVAVAPELSLYDRSGRRRPSAALAFGAGVLGHFLGRRRAYDLVHCVSYPFTALIAVRLAVAGRRRPVLWCEWVECLSAAYWRAYAGPLGGLAGRALQRACVRLTPRAICFSALVERRLREEGLRGEPHRLPGLWTGRGPGGDAATRPGADGAPGSDRVVDDGPLVLFAGRHIPDKRVTVLPDAIALARRSEPRLRAAIVGDGPERPRVLERLRALGLDGVVEAPGFVERERLDGLLGRAACFVLPSIREGYGMAVVEAIAFGVPVVVCEGPDNAATELVTENVNGAVAPRSAPREVADAILRAVRGGEELRRRTREWFGEHRGRLSMSASIARLEELYRAAGAEAAAPGADRWTARLGRP